MSQHRTIYTYIKIVRSVRTRQHELHSRQKRLSHHQWHTQRLKLYGASVPSLNFLPATPTPLIQLTDIGVASYGARAPSTPNNLVGLLGFNGTSNTIQPFNFFRVLCIVWQRRCLVSVTFGPLLAPNPGDATARRRGTSCRLPSGSRQPSWKNVFQCILRVKWRIQ